MAMFHITILVSCIIAPVFLLNVPTKQCQDYINAAPLRSLNYNKFAGTWYEIMRYDNPWESGSSCGVAKFQYDNETFTIGLTNLDQTTNKTTNFVHVAKPHVTNTGAFTLTVSNDVTITPILMNVIATDYDEYAIVWVCKQLYADGGAGSIQGLWVYSRERTLNVHYLDIANKIINEKGFINEELGFIDQNPELCGNVVAAIHPTAALAMFPFLVNIYNLFH